MYYRIERTDLAAPDRPAQRVLDTRPYLVPGANARAAAIAFITHESAQLLGEVSELAGDKAAATAARDGWLFTIFVQRATDAIADRRPTAPGRTDESRR